MKSASLAIIALLLVSACCVGCQDSFTRQRYETIYHGMPDWQVRNILGEPTISNHQTWQYVNDHPYYKAILRFEEGKVAEKTWSYEKLAK